MANCVFQITYDVSIFMRSGSCSLFFPDSPVLNEFLWSLSRVNACLLGIFPILYVFMPRFRCFWEKKKRSRKGKNGPVGIGDSDELINTDQVGETD